jgi:hypothetical protein
MTPRCTMIMKYEFSLPRLHFNGYGRSFRQELKMSPPPHSFPSCRVTPLLNPLNAELNPICHLLVILGFLTFMGPCFVCPNIRVYPTRSNVTQFIYIWTLLYMFRVVLPHIIRSAYNCIYSIWYLSHRYCYLPLSWKSWNRFECAVGGVRHPQPHDGCKYHSKHVEQFPDINKLCNVESCWIYIGIQLGAHPILHISRIRVNKWPCTSRSPT